jgi:hypothetical protein
MNDRSTPIEELRESPHRVLLPTRERSIPFIAALLLAAALSIFSFFFTSVII